ncbi:MAG: hypothetical protein WB983_06595 [Terriglobales bacterium]
MDKLGDLPAALFSPAKMIYISFVVLTGLKILPAALWLFFLVSAVFMIGEVAHNDWLRIRLNIAAEKHRR